VARAAAAVEAEEAAAGVAAGGGTSGATTMRTTTILRFSGPSAAAVLLLLAAACRKPDPGSFATPQEASAALASLAGSHDEKRTIELFGPDSLDLFRTGDAEEDRREAEQVKAMMAAKVEFEELDASTQILLLGEAGWPFPIPLVKAGERWRFDTAAGRSELLNRRVGYFELATLDSLHEYVDAQREYESEGRDGNPRAFARRFLSSEGKRDGLYWPVAEGEPESPLGDLLVRATIPDATAPVPFRGYFYRILEGQGPNALGGEFSFVDEKGRMTRGFAAVAWPSKYGNSGIKTFVVNQRGIVFEKDLGAETDALARAMTVIDPDASWNATADSLSELEEEGSGEEEPAPPAS
jgi:hypothetical protein